MFESTDKIREDVLGLLAALRTLAGGRYAAIFEAKGIVLESPTTGDRVLRRFIEAHARDLLQIPAALHGDAEMQDHFADWAREQFFLAFVNGKVGVLAVCAEAKQVEQESGPLLKALVDRLLRWNPTWRLDQRGRGFLAGRPRLDTVAIGSAEE